LLDTLGDLALKRLAVLFTTLAFFWSVTVASGNEPRQTSLRENTIAVPSGSQLATAHDGSIIRKLYSMNIQTDYPSRGAAINNTLGCYVNRKTKVIFNSGYENVDARIQSRWAYELHLFIVDNGGGWDNYRKYLSENKSGTNLQETPKDLVGHNDADDPMVRAHVPYDKQAVFADTWWKRNSQSYNSSVVPPKDRWNNDAILDGNNLWFLYEQSHGSGKGLTDYHSWRDAELVTLIQKK